MKPHFLHLLTALLLISGGQAFAQPATSNPTSWGWGLPQDNGINGSLVQPANANGALGRNYLVLKANIEVAIISRPLSSGFNPGPSTMSDQQFWATAANPTNPGSPGSWNTNLSSGSIILPNQPGIPAGTVSFTPISDGKIVYDPYDPCGNGGGHFIIAEIATFALTNNNVVRGVLVGVSLGDNPTPQTGAWNVFGIVSQFGSSTQAADYPQVGFNSSWLTINAAKFFPDDTGGYSTGSPPLIFVFTRSREECTSGAVPSGQLPMAASGNGQGLCTGSETQGTGYSYYCDDYELSYACPAQTYQTYGQNLDANNEYVIQSKASNSAAQLFEISASANGQPPTYMGLVKTAQISTQSYPGDGATGWSQNLPASLPQDGGGSYGITPGPMDDAFTGCVVRNYGIWAAQAVGLPADGPQTSAIQFWNIGVDNNLGTIYSFQRIGGDYSGYTYDTPSGMTPMNTMEASVGVNYYSDVVLGFGALPLTGSGHAFLGQAYALKNHASVSFYAPNIWDAGAGSYYGNGTGTGAARSGDETEAQVDPGDDYSLWVTGDVASGAVQGYLGNGSPWYGWQTTWELMSPQTPVQPTFSGYWDNEDQCDPYNPGTPCYDTVEVPSTFQPGDTAYAVVATGTTLGSQSSPGWYPLTEIDGNTYEQVSGTDQYGCPVTQYYQVYAHKVVAGDTAYEFQVPSELSCNDTEINVIGVALIGYHNAQRAIFSPTGFQQLLLYGAAAVDVGIQSPQTNFPGYNTLANLFYGTADYYAGQCEYFSLDGTPVLTTETPLTQCYGSSGALAPLLDGDLWTGGGGSFGPYDMYDGINGPKAAYSLSIYPY